MRRSREIAFAERGPARVPRISPVPAVSSETERGETQVGASFVGTSGNTETTTVGGEFTLVRRWPAWQIESGASAIRTSDHDVRMAERYLAAIRGKRQLTAILGLSAGERVERDRLAGIDFRSILDGGLNWALVRLPRWTLDGLTALGWTHEELSPGPSSDHPIGVLEAVSRIPFGASASSTQRVTFYPDFKDASAYRSEAEVTAEAAMNDRLALKLGHPVFATPTCQWLNSRRATIRRLPRWCCAGRQPRRHPDSE